MARVNVYLPDDLATAVREAGLNVSGIAQEALAAALTALETDRWLDGLVALGGTAVTHDQVLDAVALARDELGTAEDG